VCRIPICLVKAAHTAEENCGPLSEVSIAAGRRTWPPILPPVRRRSGRRWWPAAARPHTRS
jgi:hypothetical protein